MISLLQSEFKVFYLDDGILGGPVEAILQDLQQLELDAAELGLQLNHGKSELICDEGSTRETVLQKVPGLRQVGCSQVTLLGSPIGSEEAISDVIKVKTGMLEVMGNRLNLLPSHDALLLLRSSFAIPKVLYLLCTAPCFLSEHCLLGGPCRAAAMEAEQRKRSKYSHLEVTHCFIPVAVETLGAMGPEARSLFKEIALRF